MKTIHWMLLLGWWVYVAEPAAWVDAYGRVYSSYNWVAKERFIFREFCEARATEYRRQGQQSVCQYVND